MDRLANASVIAGYWDRVANHNSEMQQYLSSLEEMTGEDHQDLMERMRSIQKDVSYQRNRWQGMLPRGRG